MDSRPLHKDEIDYYQGQLSLAKEQLKRCAAYVAFLEQTLAVGTAWCEDAESEKQMYEEIGRMVRADRAREAIWEAEFLDTLTPEDKQLYLAMHLHKKR